MAVATRRRSSGRAARSSAAHSTVARVAALAAWALASSALIFMNKRLLVDARLPFPLALTGCGQLVSAACAVAASVVGLAPPLGRRPSLSSLALRLAPAVLCSAGTLYLGNAAYLSLSVAFIQILKAAVPALTLGVATARGLERWTPALAASVALICAGSAVATAAETGSAAFSWAGFGLFAGSAVLEAGRVVAMQALLSPSPRASSTSPLSPNEVTAYVGPPTGLLLLLAAAAVEGPAQRGGGLDRARAAAPAVFAALLTGYAVNATTAAAIRATSSLTFKVAGCLKNTAVVAAAVVAGGDVVTLLQGAGYGVSVLGFLLYTVTKQQQGGGGGGGGKTQGKRA